MQFDDNLSEADETLAAARRAAEGENNSAGQVFFFAGRSPVSMLGTPWTWELRWLPLT